MDTDKLKVAELRSELQKRNEDTRGTQAVLRERLQQVLQEEALNEAAEREGKIEGTEATADDARSVGTARSVRSRVSTVSNRSSVTSERAIEAARRAALRARAASLKKKHELEKQEAQLRRMKEELELQAELEESEAKEEVLATFEQDAKSLKPEDKPTENKQRIEMKTCDSEEGEELKAQDAIVETDLKTSTRVIKRMHLPALKLSIFNGRMELYRTFKRTFEMNVTSKLDNEEEKLMYLMQFTEGKPKDIVETCLHLPPEQGYQEALRLLDRRYSNEAQTAQGLVDRMLAQVDMKSDDVASLDSFAIQLRGTLNALRNLPYGTGVVDTKTMLKIIEKMPFMADRWRREVDHIEHEEQRRTDFTDLVEFVEKEARIASNPTYGRHVLNPKTAKPVKEQRTNKPVTGRSLVGKVNTARTEQDSCLFCQERHETDSCPKLEAKTHEEKTDFVRSKGLCFSCMKKGHMASLCRQRSTCTKCDRRHPTVLHRLPRVPDPAVGQAAATTGHAAPRRDNGGKLQVIPVKVTINGRTFRTGAFLDTGSTHSFITRQLLCETDMVPERQVSMTVSTIASDKKMNTWVVSGVTIESEETGAQQELPPLYTLDTIPVTKDDIPSADDVSRWPYLLDSEVSISDQTSVPVGLLIGSNAAAVMEPLRVIPGEDGGPYAILTRFGWTLGGVKKVDGKCRVNHIKVSRDDGMKEEWFENRAEIRRGLSVEDVKWCAQMETGCVKKEKYEIKMPFREQKPALLNNRGMAERRLNLLKRKFEREEVYAEEYTARMNKLLEDGHAEVAPELPDDSGRWYLPHFAVRHQTKGTLRVVFDCASKYRGISLNDTLLQGPDLTTPLTDVLLRFRKNPCAFTGDIEAMFLQVSVPENQRDYLRFLWWPRGTTEPAQEYRMTVHLFGATSSPSCANFALHRTAEDYGAWSREASETIRNNFYVDDVLKSVEDEETAIRLLKELKDMCARGGFNLTKFNSNSIEVLQSVPRQERAKQVKDLTLGSDLLPTERALGVLWDPNTDALGFHVDVQKLQQKPATRRGMLSATASCYDPMGLAAPCIVKARIIIQELHRLTLGWDDEVPESQKREWERWLTDLHNLSSFRVPRCMSPLGLNATLGGGGRIELHHFADASTRAYGVVSYVRSVGDVVNCRLIFSKARLAPMKPLSVPRLELAAATLAVKCNLELVRALAVEPDVFFWTDSTTVLKYIQNVRTRFHVFVANRLAIIHDGSAVAQWRYVPSESNPADLVSRGMHASGLIHSDLWQSGPSFLQSTSERWPAAPANKEVDCDDPEVKAVASAATVQRATPIEGLARHYSSWSRLVRAVALLRRLIRLWRRRRSRQSELLGAEPSPLALADLEAAECCILRDVQFQHFRSEMSELKAGRPVRTSSSLARLDPWLDGDVLRVGGRLKNSALPLDSKCPRILPRRDPVVDLIITGAHEKAGHEGRQHVLADLRTSYWILGANAAVRRCISRCISCKKRQKQPESQKMADLPEERVQVGEKAFTHTGVDYFGPFYVKRGRSLVKKYGVVFTCLAIRAVHIEVADSLSTDSFICALRRFVARRGGVRSLRSDQGTNFVGAEKELRQELSYLKEHADSIREAALRCNIDWHFHPPHASHFGGVWERQIRTIRKILNSLLTQQSFSDETLQTLLCEVEAIINNRPLTPVSADVRDELPLTPNHLLLLRCVLFPPSVTVCDHRRSWRQAGYLADQFWRRWRQEFLPLLQVRSGPTTRSRTNVKKGDVVLMVDDTVPRGVWPLGRVEEALLSADGRVRSVRVRARGTTYDRPVTKIVKIIEAQK